MIFKQQLCVTCFVKLAQLIRFYQAQSRKNDDLQTSFKKLMTSKPLKTKLKENKYSQTCPQRSSQRKLTDRSRWPLGATTTYVFFSSAQNALVMVTYIAAAGF